MTTPSDADGSDSVGPVPAPGSGRQPYRLSDQERTLAINALSDAFSEGRLDADEFRDRMSAATEAKLASDLDPLFVDLPGRTPTFLQQPTRAARPHGPARPSRSPHRHPRSHPVGFGRPGPFGPPVRPPRPLVFLPIVMLILATTHFWFLLPLMFISLGMLNEASRERSRRISGRTDPHHLHGGPDAAPR